MARKKPNISEEKTEEKPSETPELNYQQDIHSADLSDIASEWADEEAKVLSGDEKPEEKSTPPVEKKEEEVKEPEKPVETKPEEKPPLDEEKLSDSIAKKLIEQIAPQDATKEERKDLRTKLKDLQIKASEEGRELTWIEASEFLHAETKESVKEEVKKELKDELKKEIREDITSEAQEIKQKEEQAKQIVEEQQKKLYAEWDRQFAALEVTANFPKVVDPADANDPGAKEQLALLTQQNEYNKKHPTAPILNAVEFFHTIYKSPYEKPEGADAPVFGAKRSITPQDTNSYTNAEVHNKSMEDILLGN